MPHFALGALLAVVVLLSLRQLPENSVLLLVLLILGAGLRLKSPVRLVCAGVLAAAGLLLFSLLDLSNSQLRESQIGIDHRLMVRIVSVPAWDERRVQFKAELIRCLSCDADWGPRKLQLSWYRPGAYPRAGDTWEVTARLKPFDSLRSPGGFDRVKWAIAKGLHARGYIRDKPPPILLQGPPVWSVTSFRERASRSLHEHDKANNRIGLVEALTLGVKDHIDSETWALLRSTGTAHLLAISGLHVSLLAGWAYVVGRVCGRLVRKLSVIPASLVPDPHAWGLLLCLCVALLYALLAGFELPVQRALIMLSVWVIASWRFRFLAPLSGLSLALLLVLIHNIVSPMSAGFWLSFGTVLALFYLHQGHIHGGSGNPDVSLTERIPIREKAGRWFEISVRLVRTHVLLGVILVPVTAWFFQTATVSAPLANLLSVPWVGFVVVPLSFLSLLLLVLGPWAAGPALIACQWSLDVLLRCLAWMQSNLDGSLTMTVPGPLVMVLCIIGLLLAMAPRGLRCHWMAVPVMLPVLYGNMVRPTVNGFEIHVLDVGQGLATLVFTREHTVLFDTGGRVSARLSQFEATVLPYLHARGRRRIDTLIVSHGDEDHAAGVPDVLRRFPDVKLIIGAGLPPDLTVDSTSCVAGKSWQLDGVEFGFLHPAVGDTGSDNDLSCVLLVHAGAGRAVLSGDIEKRAEARLRSRMDDLPVQLLIAPHHGSNTSSSKMLLDLLRPEHVVFAAGHRNMYGFPHADVQLRYKSLGTKLYVSGKLGSIEFVFDQWGLYQAPSTWWQSHRRFWHGIVNPACSELFQGRSQVQRLLLLSQKGQTLCGK